MGNLLEQYGKLPDLILKPQKRSFDAEYELFQQDETVEDIEITRYDFEIKNDDKHNLSCHLLFPKDLANKPTNLVCFLHTSGGNAMEGQFLINAFLPNTALLLFDFAGSGNSDGDYSTLVNRVFA